MTAFLIVLHVLVCLFLVLSVLLQPGARGGVGAAFGGAGGATVFGGRGANTFLAKLTAAAAVLFMLTSISLSYFVSKSSSVMRDRVPAGVGAEEAAAPADPAKDGSGNTLPTPAATTEPAGSTAPAEGAAPADDEADEADEAAADDEAADEAPATP